MESQEYYSVFFWKRIEEYRRKNMPPHIKNIFNAQGLNDHSVLEEAYRMFVQEVGYKKAKEGIPLQLEKIEKFVQSENYRSIVSEPLQDYYGPFYCKNNHESFQFEIGDQLLISLMFRLIRQKINSPEFWVPDKIYIGIENRINRRNFNTGISEMPIQCIDRDLEERSIRNRLLSCSIYSDENFDKNDVAIRIVSVDSRGPMARLQCPFCDREINIRKNLHRKGTYWNISNFVRHIHKTHCESPPSVQRKNKSCNENQSPSDADDTDSESKSESSESDA